MSEHKKHVGNPAPHHQPNKAPDKNKAKKKPHKGTAPKHQPNERPRPKRGKTHSGKKAATIVMRPQLKIHREETETVVVGWGRMNPPTVGHAELVSTIAEIAEEVGGVPLLCLSKTVNAKNPLTHSERVDLVAEAFGDQVFILGEEDAKDPMSLFKMVAEEFSKVIVVTGEEHEADYNRMLTTYNGTEFTFEETSVITLHRDPESENLAESISATKMREYARQGDLESFTKGVPANLVAEEVFKQVRYGLSLQNVLLAESDDLKLRALKGIVEYRNRNA
jgi:nicotinamide mononucleotide adenylyltransferase